MAECATMTCPDEDEIKRGFRGSYQEQCDSLDKAWTLYSEKVLRAVERKFPGLPSDLAANAMVEAFKGLFVMVKTGSFKGDHPIISLLFNIARWRAIDELRAFQVRPIAEDDFYLRVNEETEGTEEGKRWQVLADRGEANEVAQMFRDFLLALPSWQRQVAQIIADNFPDRLEEKEICDRIFERTGQRPTVVQVKSAKREIRKKFLKFLNQQKTS